MTRSLIWLLSLILHHRFMTLSLIWLLIGFYITEYRFPWGIFNGCGMATGDAYSSEHLVPSLWDLHMFYLLRPIIFRTCRCFTGLCSSNIPRYFLDFACMCYHTFYEMYYLIWILSSSFWKSIISCTPILWFDCIFMSCVMPRSDHNIYYVFEPYFKGSVTHNLECVFPPQALTPQDPALRTWT